MSFIIGWQKNYVFKCIRKKTFASLLECLYETMANFGEVQNVNLSFDSAHAQTG